MTYERGPSFFAHSKVSRTRNVLGCLGFDEWERHSGVPPRACFGIFLFKTIVGEVQGRSWLPILKSETPKQSFASHVD